jgi:hypothetical protein
MSNEENKEVVWPVYLINQSIRQVQMAYPRAIVKSVEISMPDQLSKHPHVKIEFSILTSTAMGGQG